MRKTLALLLVFALALATFAACGGGSGSTAASATEAAASGGGSAAASTADKPEYDQLTVYSALSEGEIPTYFNAFEADTGIKINYVRLSAGEMLARVAAEKENPQAAVLHGGASDTYIAANQEGLLEAYQSPELANVPEQYKDSEGIWNPLYVGAIAFVCNKDWFEENNLEYPTSWEDLTKPEFKGQISMAHPSTSGTSYTILATIIQMYGDGDEAWDYMKRLNDNVRQYTKSGAAPPTEVALGEAAIAVVFAHDGLRPAMEGYPIELSYPEEGTGVEVGAMAIVKNSAAEEQDNARRFIDWCMSARGQELFIDSASNRLPVNRNAKVTDGLVNLEDLNVIDYDAVWAGENKNELVEKFNELVNNASDLKE